MIGESKVPNQIFKPKQAMKKPIKLVISNGERHFTRRSSQERREDSTINLDISINKNSNTTAPFNSHTMATNTTNCNQNHLTNNTNKGYFGSPLPMYGGRFLTSPMYPVPLTPPLDETLAEEEMQVDDYCEERNFLHEKSLSAKHNNMFNNVLRRNDAGSLDNNEMNVDDYLSASSSDDDEEVCQLMFQNNEAEKSSSPANNNNPPFISIRNGPGTRSKTNSLRSIPRSDRAVVTSPHRVLLSRMVLPVRTLRRFKASDVVSNRPSLNFRKMRKSSFHRRNSRLPLFI